MLQLSPASLGQVSDDRGSTDDDTVGVLDRRDGAREEDLRPVLSDNNALKGLDRLPFSDLRQNACERLALLGGEARNDLPMTAWLEMP